MHKTVFDRKVNFYGLCNCRFIGDFICCIAKIKGNDADKSANTSLFRLFIAIPLLLLTFSNFILASESEKIMVLVEKVELRDYKNMKSVFIVPNDSLISLSTDYCLVPVVIPGNDIKTRGEGSISMRRISINVKDDNQSIISSEFKEGEMVVVRKEDELSDGVKVEYAIKNSTPIDPIEYMFRGLEFYRGKYYEVSIINFIKAIELEPDNFTYHKYLSYIYAEKLNMNNLLHEANEMIRINPKDSLGYTAQGYAYNLKADYKRAINSYKKALTIDSALDVIYAALGDVYAKKGNRKQAIKNYSIAASMNNQYAIKRLENIKNP